jgi:thermitase
VIGLSTVLAIVALCLVAWAMESPSRRPALALPGLLILAVAIGTRLVSGHGVLLTVGGVFLDLGAGLLCAGGYLKLREAEPRRFLLPAALSLFLAAAAHTPLLVSHLTSDHESSPKTERATGRFLLELGPDDDISEIAGVLTRYRARAERAFPRLTLDDDEDLAQYFLVYARDESLSDLMRVLKADAENVDNAEWDVDVQAIPAVEASSMPELELAGHVADDPQRNQQWGLERTQADALHERLRTMTPERSAVVAIIDTGVDSAHEDIRDSFDTSPGTGDRNGHGTHCAGIAGAATNNGLGIASYNWESRYVRIRSYKALGDNGGGSAETVAQAIIDAARDGADVISLSLGSWSPTPPKVEVDAVEFALKRGAIVVAAAGNAASDANQHAPANIEGVISVAAVDQNNRRASFSNRNTGLKRPIAAPGVGILSLKPGSRYVALNGTSMAAPHVAGLLGVMRSIDPELPADAAYEILDRTGNAGPDASSLGNTIDADGALELVVSRRFAALRLGA